MKRLSLLTLLLGLVAATSHAAEPTIGDFLYTLGTGPMAANEIVQLDASAVSNLQTTKDLAVAIGSLGNASAKDGFGIAFTPGRSQFESMAVSLARYADKQEPLARIWGNTTFSYAQNKLAEGGVDYERSAWAVNVSFYMHTDQDPIVAARNAVVRETGTCAPVLVRMFNSQHAVLTTGKTLKELMRLSENDEMPLEVIEWLSAQAKGQNKAPPSSVAALLPQLANQLPKLIDAQKSGAIKLEDSAKLASDLNACADKARTDAKKRWNASQATFVLAEGRIKPTSGADAKRLSLGTHAAVAIALGQGDNGLFNLTLRRVYKELDLDTLTTTPAYKNTTVAAARYTYGQPGRDTYALAEISNVKQGTNTVSNLAFKQALGIDHKLAAGFWLEFRYGRARTSDGSKLENKALINIKFSPESTLDKKN